MAIEDVFPEQTVPDQNNFLPGGRQFKAPDHAILDGKVFIERKSRNAADNSRVYYKLQEIAKNQGKPFYAVGQFNMGRIIETLPNPEDASRKLTDFILGQMMKSIRNAKHKFEEHAKYVDSDGQLRILIISDNTEMRSSTAADEYFVGRKMGGLELEQDETGMIDAVILVKNPEFVLDQPNSYWYKCLVKRRVASSDHKTIKSIASALHTRISCYGPYFPHIQKVRRGRYRPLIT
ncbi:hypothetical protein [Mesorhizobium sp. DCY119]|uniref:hypothetical protein n=1 Tax=Mesorhizobium sp. DCY119 TaxID=2108445 RepID=UPI000E71F734|nr:hypothetical protein [Mesorhizobium sp. DCY119]RJG46643.1 hypothetical protein D3Y55_21900 [Mesorhizobium sp. DCY119]